MHLLLIDSNNKIIIRVIIITIIRRCKSGIAFGLSTMTNSASPIFFMAWLGPNSIYKQLFVYSYYFVDMHCFWLVVSLCFHKHSFISLSALDMSLHKYNYMNIILQISLYINRRSQLWG